MRRLSGQAALILARLLHWLAGVALFLVILSGVGLTLLGWRLSQGPLELPWLAHHIEATVNAEDNTTHFSIGSAALAWEGFNKGVDRPLDLRLRAVDVTDSGGARLISVPSAEVSLSLVGLLLGRIEPRGIEINDAQLKVFRSAEGDISLHVGTPTETTDTPDATPPDQPGIRLPALITEFGKPASNDFSLRHSRFGQLRRVLIDNASVIVVDHQLQATWRAPKAEIDLTRRPSGGVEGHADMTVSLGDQTTRLTAAASLAEAGASTHIHAAFTPVAPAALARAAAPLAPLSMLNAPVGATLTLDLGPNLAIRQARVTAQVGAGDLHVGAATIRLVGGDAVLSADAQTVALESARISVRGHDGGPVSVISATGTMPRGPGPTHADLSVQLDQVAFADLPAIWPAGIGGGARSWITENITAGTARNAHLTAQLDIAPDFSDATLSAASGTLDGEGLTVHWLRPIPPLEQGAAQLRILDPDTIEIAVKSARQHPVGARTDNGGGGLMVRGGTVRITGLMQHEQIAKIDANLAGPIGDAIAVLRSPRLHLLDHQSIDLSGASGQLAGKLSISLPLDADVTIDAIAIAAQARLDGVRVAGLVGGRDLNQGAIDLKVNNDGMTVAGQAVLGVIPATFDAAFDFRAGPGSQVLQTVNLAGQPTAAQLTGSGFNPGGIFVKGAPSLRLKLTERRDGKGQVGVSADLADADMRLDVAGWTKPAGAPAQGDAVIRLEHDRLVGIDKIDLSGAEASIQGHATFAAGAASVLQIDQFTLGKTSAKGSVSFPVSGSGPIVANVTGTSLDLSRRLSYHAPKDEKTATDHVSIDTKADEGPGQPWKIDARFDHALMANAQNFDALVLHAESNGKLLTRLRFDARAGREPIVMEIAPAPGGRRLTASAANAGGLLRALDIMDTMDGGRLTVDGSFDDRAADQPLSGTANIEDFRIRNAPAMARVLQAMTLYGLVDLVNGPGLGFSHLIAPFRLAGPVLELSDARAFNSSLGLTAKGRIDLAADRADIAGTVVPAYFFNSLLGKVPLLGKLFSPEQGGGLFAASYAVRGKLSDPTVSVNPLAALTPGILRGIFGDL
jgi:hypothetical protein